MQNFTETITIADDGIRRTADGYLIADVRVARTGIQTYLGSEVNKPEMPFVRVYRSPEEVFKEDSLKTYAHKPVTVGHPDKSVTADTWKKHAVGKVDGEIVRDGGFVRVPMMVMDADAIKIIDGGVRQLSAGYTTQLVFDAGKTPEGQEFDAYQTDIRVNHVAIVPRGRAGNDVKIGDSWGAIPVNDKEPPTVTEALRKIAVQDQAFLVNDDGERAINLMKEHVKSLTDSAAGAAAIHKAAIDAKDAEIGALKVEVQQLKDSALTPATMDAAVKARAALLADAAVLLPKTPFDDLADADIRRKVVVAKMGDGFKDMSDASVEGAFNALKVMGGGDPLRGVKPSASPMPTPTGDTAISDQALAEARAGMVANLTDPTKNK